MAIITAISAALALINSVNNLNLTANNLRIEKEHFYTDAVIASQNQNVYCLNFINELESKDKIEDFTNVTVLTHGLNSSFRDWLVAYQDDGEIYENEFMVKDYSIPSALSELTEICCSDDEVNLPIYVFGPWCGTLREDEENEGYPDETDTQNVGENVTDVYIKQLTYNGDCFEYSNNPYNSRISINDINNKKIVLMYSDMYEKNYNLEISQKRFELSLSNVLCQIYNAQLGHLGKINLIGHSKGGILNAEFAANHSKLINNLIGLGVPYEGSTWAKTLAAIRTMAKLASGTSFSSNDTLNIIDINNQNRISKLSSKFNSKCQDVNTYAIGFNMTSSSLVRAVYSCITGDNAFPSSTSTPSFDACVVPHLLKEYVDSNFEVGPVTELVNRVASRVNTSEFEPNLNDEESRCFAIIRVIVCVLKIVANEMLNEFYKAKAVTDWVKSIFDFFGGNEVVDAFSEINNVLIGYANAIIEACEDFHFISNKPNDNLIDSDVCVNTSSQIGSNYFNFDKTDIITIHSASNPTVYDYEHCARPRDPAVPHNFEAKNPEAVNNILDFLSEHNGLGTFDITNIDITKSFRLSFFVEEKDAIEALFLKQRIKPAMYGLEDYYVYEKDLKVNPNRGIKTFTTAGSTIMVNILRTGYIQGEKIVLSPNRTDAKAAYIEYTFNSPIYRIDIDLSMWSENEEYDASGQKLFLVYEKHKIDAIKNSFLYPRGLSLSDYSTAGYSTSEIIYDNLLRAHMLSSSMYLTPIEKMFNTDILKKSLLGFEIDLEHISKNRNNQDKVVVYFDEPVTSFGLYTGVKDITSQTRNKGRVCIGDIVTYE